jgi:hypothetical protein
MAKTKPKGYVVRKTSPDFAGFADRREPQVKEQDGFPSNYQKEI